MHKLLNCPKLSNKHQHKQIADVKMLTLNKYISSIREEKALIKKLKRNRLLLLV